MATNNSTYYNPKGNRFTGMFDSGQGSDFVPVDWSKITGDIVDKLQTVDSKYKMDHNTLETLQDCYDVDMEEI